MRKDSIDPSAIEKALLIYKEHGHQIVDYDFSHPPTDYKRGTVEEPEHTSKLRDTYNELLPATARNQEFNSLARRDEEVQKEIEIIQQAMVTSRRMGNFQMLQNQMKQMQALIKEKESIDAKMAVANLGAAEMDVYNDTMKGGCEYSEMSDISTRIAELEQAMKDYMGE
jgi:hypothetical protein